MPRRSRLASKYFLSSISGKIITPYLLLTLVFTAFGIFVVTQLVVVSLEERLKNQLVDAGNVVGEEVVNRENLRLEVERLVANTIEVPDALIARDTAKLNRLVSPYIANYKSVDSIIILDTQGKELVLLQRETDSPNAPVETDLGSEVSYASWPAVQKVLKNADGGVKEIQLGKDPESGRLIIYTVGPIRTQEDEIVGAAMVGTYLSKEINALHSVALADLTLFDENTNIIASTLLFDETQGPEEAFANFTPERYQEVIARDDITLLDEISIETENETETYRVAYVPFMLRRRVAGIYGVALPTNFITETDNTTRNQLIIGFSVGVAAVFVVGYLVSNWIVNPILQLVRTSQAIAKGDLTQRTGLDLDDEIGILAHTFDEMTGELQRKTDELEEEASKLNAILSSIADGVLVQDLAGNIIRMNPTAGHILEELGDDFTLSVYPSLAADGTDDGVAQEQMSLLGALTGLRFHETQRFEVGRRVLSALSAPVVTTDGERLGSVIVLRDITREVESERLKDDFITSVSHELKTPLTAVKGYLDLLKMMAAGKLSEREIGWLQSSDKEIVDLDKIIQKMLDMTQSDAGQLGVDSELIDLSELVEAESEKWVEKMEEKGLTFQVHTPAEPVWVEGDWDKLGEVVNNLIENAHHYTLEGTVKVQTQTENGRAQVAVIDTGVGILEEDQGHLFTRFFRAIHAEGTYEISGAGLGLYMSKAYVEAHTGGKMGMESEPYQGSTFYFTLPAANLQPDDLEEKPVEYVESQ